MVAPTTSFHQHRAQAFESCSRLRRKAGVAPHAAWGRVPNTDGFCPNHEVASLLRSERVALEQRNQSSRILAVRHMPHRARIRISFSRCLLIDAAESGDALAIVKQGRIVAAEGNSKLAPHAPLRARTVVANGKAAFAINEASEPMAEVVRDFGIRFGLHGRSFLLCHAPGRSRVVAGARYARNESLSHGRRMV